MEYERKLNFIRKVRAVEYVKRRKSVLRLQIYLCSTWVAFNDFTLIFTFNRLLSWRIHFLHCHFPDGRRWRIKVRRLFIEGLLRLTTNTLWSTLYTHLICYSSPHSLCVWLYLRFSPGFPQPPLVVLERRLLWGCFASNGDGVAFRSVSFLLAWENLRR